MTLLVLVVGGLGVGLWLGQQYTLPIAALDLMEIPDKDTVDQLVAQIGLLPVFSTRAVFVNNVRSLLLAALLGALSLGTLALILLMAPIVIIVYLGLQIGQIGVNPWLFLVVTVLPHGIIELPAAIVATSQAMRLGDVILIPPDKGGGIFGIIRELGHFIKLLVLVVAPLLLVAAWIEVNITPRLLGLVPRFVGRSPLRGQVVWFDDSSTKTTAGHSCSPLRVSPTRWFTSRNAN